MNPFRSPHVHGQGPGQGPRTGSRDKDRGRASLGQGHAPIANDHRHFCLQRGVHVQGRSRDTQCSNVVPGTGDDRRAVSDLEGCGSMVLDVVVLVVVVVAMVMAMAMVVALVLLLLLLLLLILLLLLLLLMLMVMLMLMLMVMLIPIYRWQCDVP